jgi:DNA-binding CsgD family transcriptional regulator
MTIRTRQIIALLSAGKSYREIADLLGITEAAVKQDVWRNRKRSNLRKSVTFVTQSVSAPL